MEEDEEVKRPKGCITLQGDDFILEQIEDSSIMFDLKLKRIVHGRNGIDREEFKHEAYGLPIDIAFWRIMMYRLSKKDYRDIKSLNSFIWDFKVAANKAYKQLRKEIRNERLRG